jgi:hypothetical protein
MERFVESRFPSKLPCKTVGLVWDLFDRGLSWLGGLLCYRLIKCLNVGVVDKFFFLLRCGICRVGVFAGFESLDNPDCVEFGEFDPPRNFWV